MHAFSQSNECQYVLFINLLAMQRLLDTSLDRLTPSPPSLVTCLGMTSTYEDAGN